MISCATLQRPQTSDGHLMQFDQPRQYGGADLDPEDLFVGIHNGSYASQVLVLCHSKLTIKT